jgi:single-strand DNA-binding protein
MNRWTGIGHLTRDPELETTPGGTEICPLRIGVAGAGKNYGVGYFDVKAFGGQALACAEHLKSGREVAIEGRLRFEQWTGDEDRPRSRVYIAADQVEFLNSRGRRRDGEGESPSEQRPQERGPEPPAAVAAEAGGSR